MTSWNRRVAAASRVRDTVDPDGIESKLESLGLPRNIHPDDAVAIITLVRVAEGRTPEFQTTVLARLEDGQDGHGMQIRVAIHGSEDGAVTVLGDAELPLDPLTGLPGRAMLLESLEDILRARAEDEHLTAVYSIDIDRFKTVNDTRGFAAGDETLRTLAGKLGDALRANDLLTRFSGDEFTIVCPRVAGTTEATALAERFRSTCIDAPVESPLGGVTVSVGFSVGGGNRAAEDLVREAETALYKAKGLGRDRCELFDDELRSRAEHHNTVDQRLRKALDDDAIQVHYQPVVDLHNDNQVVGCEALLRIVGDDGEHLNPREMVGAAEDSGLIRRIEETVLHRAAAAIRALPVIEDDPLFVSVNISDRRLLDSRFPLSLARTLHNADLAAEQVHLELNTDILGQTGPRIRLITQLRALGVRVVIDEYLATSESELLAHDRIDLVKLDKRLVHGIHSVRGRARAELAIGSVIDRGVPVCAVGVETVEDLAAVTELGCRYAQGYLFSPPVEVGRLAELVRGDN